MEQISLFNPPKEITYKNFNELIKKWRFEEGVWMQIYNAREDIEEVRGYVSIYMRKMEVLEFVIVKKEYEEKLIERVMKKFKKYYYGN